MMDNILSSEIKIRTKKPKVLKEILELETKRKKYDRSDSNIKIEKDAIVIEIFAKDIIAYKATVNQYINLLELIKKTYEVDL
ncbi:MAG: KEOPS complex subunit Pcc1 [Candidatus ainarchaeum sp.]|nr:KEOPS complex subunit Pcc1 [Candidatus ainarchaeum sp.]